MRQTKESATPKRTRKRRPPEEKIDILAEVAVRTEAGETKETACAAVDVPRQTVNSWIDQGLMEDVLKGTTDSAYRRLKSKMLGDFALAAQAGVQTVAQLMQRVQTSKDPSDTASLAKATKDIAIALGISADKVMLLTGQATSRSERVTTNEGDLLTDARRIINALKVPQQPVIEAEYTVTQASHDNVDYQRTTEDKPS